MVCTKLDLVWGEAEAAEGVETAEATEAAPAEERSWFEAVRRS